VLLQHGNRLAEDVVERHGGSSACRSTLSQTNVSKVLRAPLKP
jgi:hypothetical protein